MQSTSLPLLLCLIVGGAAGFALLVLLVLKLAKPSRSSRARAPRPGEPMPSPGGNAAQLAQPNAAPPYALITTLLTQAEQALFEVLRRATPDTLLICPQVRLASLVRPTSRRRKQNQYDFYRIQAKCVDFVLCDARTTAPRLVIELDDRSHERPDRQARDAFVDAVLAHIGLPILHIPWQRSYDEQELARRIRAVLGLADAPPARPSSPRDAPARSLAAALPIAAAPAASAEPAVYAAHYVCGACQGEVRREAQFCTHCGATISR